MREKETRAQDEQAREKSKAQEEREEERKVEAQEGHDGEGEMTTQVNCVETRKGMNSMSEENDVSNRHDMVAKRLVGPYGQRPTPTDGARPSKSVASSHESRAGHVRHRTD